MKNWAGKRYWLVGASEGLGRALAQEMSAAGAELVLSARNTERLAVLAASLPGPARVVAVDIADHDSVQAAAQAAGDLDGVVFLAGVYWPMASQNWQAVQAETMADINFTGAVRVMGAVVPAMVARGRGHLVLTGSLAGFRGLPGAIGYGASKAGVMALAESMHCDLRATGVQVQLVNPGFIRTRLTEQNDFAMPFIMEPEAAARVMFAHMNTGRFSCSFPRVFSWVFRGAQFLPDWLYYRLYSK
ncbi:MAG: SDR family NAD(P)-dependent oxidoreductase [Paracoccaceae bacterium]|nr:SDR family NAD(P)-dependent oxidoreductase [Paracoccaceae bacterium]